MPLSRRRHVGQTHQQNLGPIVGGGGGGGGAWFTLYSSAIVTDNAGWSGYTMRQAVATAAYGGTVPSTATQIRVTMTAASSAGITFSQAWVGHAAASGDAIDFDGTQVQLLFSTATGGTIAAGGSLLSDAKLYAFDKTKPLVMTVHFSGASDVKSTTPLTNFTGAWALDGSDIYAPVTDITVGGVWDVNSRLYLFSKVEVFG